MIFSPAGYLDLCNWSVILVIDIWLSIQFLLNAVYVSFHVWDAVLLLRRRPFFSPRTTQTSPWLPAKLRGGPLATTSLTAYLDDKHCNLYRQPILIPFFPLSFCIVINNIFIILCTQHLICVKLIFSLLYFILSIMI